MTLKNNALLMALMMFLCCSCNVTKVNADFKKEGSSQEEVASTILDTSNENKDSGSLNDSNLNSVESEGDDSGQEEVPDISSLDNISRLSNNAKMFSAYYNYQNSKKGIYDRTNLIHNQAELDNYLNKPLSDLRIEDYTYETEDLYESVVLAFKRLPDDFFTNYNLVVTCQVLVPTSFGIEFSEVSFSENTLKLFYQYNPNNRSYDPSFTDSNYVDLLAVEKGTNISSIEVYVRGMPNNRYTGEILKP